MNMPTVKSEALLVGGPRNGTVVEVLAYVRGPFPAVLSLSRGATYVQRGRTRGGRVRYRHVAGL